MTANDASFPERATAYDVAYMMKAKAKIGMGMSNTKMHNFQLLRVLRNKIISSVCS